MSVRSSSILRNGANRASRTSSTRWPWRRFLADLGMGPLVVAAGLLHDTVEDTDYTLDECRAEFGDTVTGLVDGVTKLSKMEYGDSAQAETIRKMVVAMSRDVRVLVVKLADRVHKRVLGVTSKLRARRRKRMKRLTCTRHLPIVSA